jgi:predicted dehydrogenase
MFVQRRRVMVCGAGSVGRRHVTNLQRLGVDVSLWRARPDLAADTAAELGVEAVTDLEYGLANAEAVVVATAPDYHMPIALAAAAAGRAMYLEKPLSHDRTGVDRLHEAVREKSLVVEVGCQLRSHPCLRAMADHVRSGADGRLLTFRGVVGQRLDQWRPGTDYRASYSAQTNRGGGALFDLVHEIDLVHWIAGPIAEVVADQRHTGDLAFEADDLVNLIALTREGIAGQLQLDMLSPVYRRSFEVVLANALLEFDYVSGTLVRRDTDGRHVMMQTSKAFERNDVFLTHMAAFLGRLDNPQRPPTCSLDDGIAVLDVALAVRASHQARQFVAVA